MLPVYDLALHLPPPSPAPTLTVSAWGRAYPSKALITQLRLRAGQPIDVLPPAAEVTDWLLDLRPTARQRISWYQDTRPRITCLRLPAGLLAPGQKLTLALDTATTHCPDLYHLLPVPATPLTEI